MKNNISFVISVRWSMQTLTNDSHTYVWIAFVNGVREMSISEKIEMKKSNIDWSFILKNKQMKKNYALTFPMKILLLGIKSTLMQSIDTINTNL